MPGNIGASIALMMGYSFFKKSALPNRNEILLAVIGAAIAVNTKPQLQPLMFVLCFLVFARLLWLSFKNKATGKIWLKLPIAVLILSLIFATPIKNTILCQNPLYPIKIEVAGISLNHEMTPETYSEGNRPIKWMRSIFEDKTPKWTPAQWNYNDYQYFD